MIGDQAPFSGDSLRRLRILRARLREIAPAGIIKVLQGEFGKHFIKVQISWRGKQRRYRYEKVYTHQELIQIRSIQLIYDELVDAVRAEVEKVKKEEGGRECGF